MRAVVIAVKENKAAVATASGELGYVDNKGYEVGQILELDQLPHKEATGKVLKRSVIQRFPGPVKTVLRAAPNLAAAAVLLLFTGGMTANAASAYTVSVDAGERVVLSVNMFDRVIGTDTNSSLDLQFRDLSQAFERVLQNDAENSSGKEKVVTVGIRSDSRLGSLRTKEAALVLDKVIEDFNKKEDAGLILDITDKLPYEDLSDDTINSAPQSSPDSPDGTEIMPPPPEEGDMAPEPPQDDGAGRGEVPPQDDGAGRGEAPPQDDGAGRGEAPPQDDGAGRGEVPPQDEGVGHGEVPPRDDGEGRGEAPPRDEGREPGSPSPQGEAPAPGQVPPTGNMEDGHFIHGNEGSDTGAVPTQNKSAEPGSAPSEDTLSNPAGTSMDESSAPPPAPPQGEDFDSVPPPPHGETPVPGTPPLGSESFESGHLPPADDSSEPSQPPFSDDGGAPGQGDGSGEEAPNQKEHN